MDFMVVPQTVRLGGFGWLLIIVSLSNIKETTVLTILKISKTDYRNPDTIVDANDLLILRDRIIKLNTRSMITLSSLVPMGEFGLVDYICSTSSSVQNGLQQLQKYFYLLNLKTHRINFHSSKDSGIVLLNGSFLDLPNSMLWYKFDMVNFTFVHILSRMRLLTNQSISPTLIKLKQVRSSNHYELLLRYGCNIAYEAKINAMYFSRKTLDLKYSYTEFTGLHAIICNYADTIKTPTDFKGQVLNVLRIIPLNKKYNLSVISDQLNTTSRTLRRKLKAEGAKYTDLRDHTMLEKAKNLLCDPGISLKQIWVLLGYSSPDAFNKAFFRLTGQSPKDYRINSIKF